MKLQRFFLAAATVALAAGFTSCSDDDEIDFSVQPDSNLYILSNGQYGYGNGSLSFYDPVTEKVENNVFYRANGVTLGDVAQSMVISGNTGWIVVNNSGVVFAIDLTTYKEKGRIVNLVSPRNIFFINDHKAYITHLYSNTITIIDPTTYTVTGTIEVPGMNAATGSTEDMVMINDYVYCNCWSYQKNIIKIDPVTDKVVDTLEVGVQPESMVIDAYGYLWVLCDGGGWAMNPVGYEEPTLLRINPSQFKVDRTFTFPLGESVSNLVADVYAHTLYWINDGVQRMNIDSTTLPSDKFISGDIVYPYTLTVSPSDGDIYVGDAVDFQQAGTVWRFDSNGMYKSKFSVGVIPAAFCWD